MKNKGYSLLLLVPILFLTTVLSSCKIMTSSDYKKAKEVVSSELAQVGLHGKVTITQLSWTALEYPQYHVRYTYSEKTYDDQTVRLEKETNFHDDWSDSYSSHLPEYKEAFLEQKSIKNIEEKLETEIKKQSLGRHCTHKMRHKKTLLLKSGKLETGVFYYGQKSIFSRN